MRPTASKRRWALSIAIAELEKVLGQLVAEHATLLTRFQEHAAAMPALRLGDLAAAGQAIEASRTRIVFLESRRKLAIAQVVRLHKVSPTASLAELAELSPPHRLALLKHREQLRALVAQIARRGTISAKVAGAMLGHLNSAVRLIAGAVQQANVYTRHGTPGTRQRIGVMEAVA